MIVVFDAKCLLCSGWVRFLLKRRGGQHIQFASMQGATGSRLLLEAGLAQGTANKGVGLHGRLLCAGPPWCGRMRRHVSQAARQSCRTG